MGKEIKARISKDGISSPHLGRGIGDFIGNKEIITWSEEEKMKFPSTLGEERRRAIVETLVWVIETIPDIPEDFYDDIPINIHDALLDELEKQGRRSHEAL